MKRSPRTEGGGDRYRGGSNNGPSRFAQNSDRRSGPGEKRGGWSAGPDAGARRGGWDGGGSGGGGEGGFKPREFSEDRPPRRTFHRDDAPGASWSNSNSRPQQARRPWTPPTDRGGSDFAPAAAAASAPASQPVSMRKLKEGIAAANRALAELMEEFGSGILGNYDICDLEVPVSFGNDGRFLGFGKGGAVTFALTITPLEAENLFEGEGEADEEGEEGEEGEEFILAGSDLDDDLDEEEDADGDSDSSDEEEDDEDEEDEEEDDEEAALAIKNGEAGSERSKI